MAAPIWVQQDAVDLTTTNSTPILTMASTYSSSSTMQNIRIRISNYSGGASTYTVYTVASGGPAAGSETGKETSIPALNLAAGATVDVDVDQLEPGGVLRVKASVANALRVGVLSAVIFS